MRRRVVIIDNDTDDLEMLETAILQVSPAATCLSFVFADEAIRVIGEELNSVPDFIFIDVNMSRVSGPDCLRMLKEIHKLKDCKIIMFSGVMPAVVGESFINAGAFTFFQKPLHESAYREKIMDIFSRSSHESVHSSPQLNSRHRL
jgi:DNA-binding NtrC family response regulator